MTQISQKKEQQEEQNDIFSQIETILGKQEEGAGDIGGMKKKIRDILFSKTAKKYKTTALHYISTLDPELYRYLPEELKNDPDIIQATLEAKGSLIEAIPLALQSQRNYLQLSIDSLAEKTSDFPKLMEILEKYKKDTKLCKDLEDFIRERYYEKFLPRFKLAFDIFTQEYETFILLRIKGCITPTSQYITVPAEFLASISPENYELLQSFPEAQRQKILQEYFILYLGISVKNISKLLQSCIEFLCSELKIPKQKNTPTEDTLEDEKNQKIKKNKDSQIPDEISTTQEAYLFSPQYRSFSIGNTYIVSNTLGETVTLEREKLESMSEVSLERYFLFVTLLKHLDLSFLLQKHASKIQLATDINFYTDGGMSDARILKFLNSVAKNIGIPEKSFQKEGSEEKEIACFQTLDGAKMAFEQVKSTGQAGSNFICAPADKGDYSIVELALKARGCIVPPYNEISLVAWK